MFVAHANIAHSSTYTEVYDRGCSYIIDFYCHIFQIRFLTVCVLDISAEHILGMTVHCPYFMVCDFDHEINVKRVLCLHMICEYG